jgi:hypothetical protein
MRKLILFNFLLLLLSTNILHAQSYKSNILFQKTNYPVAAIQVPFDEDVVTDAVKDYMSSKGYKDAHYKDFVVFRDVPLQANTSALSDAYFNITKKNRSEKDVTIISLLPVKKGLTLAPATEEDSAVVSSALVYLDSLVDRVQRYSMMKQIQTQQKVLDKTKSKMLSLKNDSGDLAKKIRSYESDLAQNKTSQDKQTKLINSLATGDQDGLAKAHKQMDKLLDNQTDYEKKIRNYKADLEKNTQDRQTEQSMFDSQTQALNALKQRYQAIGIPAPK